MEAVDLEQIKALAKQCNFYHPKMKELATKYGNDIVTNEFFNQVKASGIRVTIDHGTDKEDWYPGWKPTPNPVPSIHWKQKK